MTALTIDETLTIARLVLRLGEVDRATLHPDGSRYETDTTHTVMVALLAAVAADRLGLDAGRAALLALVHDLPEAYAGDVDTSAGLSPAARAAKARREEEALALILAGTASMPILRSLVLRYELGTSAEAQLVHLLDKAAPKAVRLTQHKPAPLTAGQREAAIRQLGRLRERAPLPLLESVHSLLRELVQQLVVRASS